MSQKKCKNCGCLSDEDAIFCKNCGSILPANTDDNTVKSEIEENSSGENVLQPNSEFLHSQVHEDTRKENFVNEQETDNFSQANPARDEILSVTNNLKTENYNGSGYTDQAYSNIPPVKGAIKTEKKSQKNPFNTVRKILSIIISVLMGIVLFTGMSLVFVNVLFSDSPAEIINETILENSDTKPSEIKIGKYINVVINGNSSDDIELSEDTTLSELIYQMISDKNKEKYKITESKIASVLDDRKSKKIIHDFLEEIETIIKDKKNAADIQSAIEKLFNDSEDILKKHDIDFKLREVDKKAIREFSENNISAFEEFSVISQTDMPMTLLFIISCTAVSVIFLLMLLILVFLNIRKMRSLLLYFGIPVFVSGSVFLISYVLLPLLAVKILTKGSILSLIVKAFISASLLHSFVIGGIIGGIGIICIISYIISKAVISFKNKKYILEDDHE